MRLAIFATLGSRNARVLEDLHHGPAVALGDRLQFAALIGRRLLGCRNLAPFSSEAYSQR
jgi:hypothetical protein